MALKRYIIRKYVMAKSAADALKIEKAVRADDCWVDDDWKKQQEFEGDGRQFGYQNKPQK